jgi:hypothetical protein
VCGSFRPGAWRCAAWRGSRTGPGCCASATLHHDHEARVSPAAGRRSSPHRMMLMGCMYDGSYLCCGARARWWAPRTAARPRRSSCSAAAARRPPHSPQPAPPRPLRMSSIVQRRAPPLLLCVRAPSSNCARHDRHRSHVLTHTVAVLQGLETVLERGLGTTAGLLST